MGWGVVPLILSLPSTPIKTRTLEAAFHTPLHTTAIFSPCSHRWDFLLFFGTTLGQENRHVCGAWNMSKIGIYLGQDERVCVVGHWPDGSEG